jgi:AhpD family alkylhydroperoxidase
MALSNMPNISPEPSDKRAESHTMKQNILNPVTIRTAPVESRPTLEKIQKTFGFIPSLMATFANSPTVLHSYLAMDAVWEKGTFRPVERSLVLLAASVVNNCEYCTAAHSRVLKGFLKVPAEIVAGVRNGKSLSDAKLDALVKYTKEIVEKRGHVSELTLGAFLAAGYTAPQAMEVLIGVALKTVSNYLDHFNPAPFDDAFKVESSD